MQARIRPFCRKLEIPVVFGFRVSGSGAWIPNGRLYKGLRICLVSLRVCGGHDYIIHGCSEISVTFGNSPLPISIVARLLLLHIND